MRHRYRIRPATRSDLHHLPAIERAAVERFRDVGLFDAYANTCLSAEAFEERQHAGCLYVAVPQAGPPVGFAAWSWLGPRVLLEEMDVDPQHGQRGIGGRLLRAVCRWATRKRASGIVLSTTRDVPWNEPFYRRHGFSEVSEAVYCEALRQLRAAEEFAGLPIARRVIMTKGPPGFP
jgi:predicted N-acetyltransferase YhbS